MCYSTSSKASVVIYSRPGCHLCDEARQAMQAAQCANEYTLEEIDIQSDVGLLRRYQYDIPVITINGMEVFRHQVTPEQFKQALRYALSHHD